MNFDLVAIDHIDYSFIPQDRISYFLVLWQLDFGLTEAVALLLAHALLLAAMS